jgi:hypothetical protein
MCYMHRFVPLCCLMLTLSSCYKDDDPEPDVNVPIYVSFDANGSINAWKADYHGDHYIPEAAFVRASVKDTFMVYLIAKQTEDVLSPPEPQFVLPAISPFLDDTALEIQTTYTYEYDPNSSITLDRTRYGVQETIDGDVGGDLINRHSWQVISDTVTVTDIQDGYASGYFSATMIDGTSVLHVTNGYFENAVMGPGTL